MVIRVASQTISFYVETNENNANNYLTNGNNNSSSWQLFLFLFVAVIIPIILIRFLFACG